MLHYGSDYFKWAIKPLLNVCDKVIVLYSDMPTHNQGTGMMCPDTRAKLYFQHPKLQWLDIHGAGRECDHMASVFNFTSGYDVLVRVDADEIWPESELKDAINQAFDGNSYTYGIDGFVHFWRSFNNIAFRDYFRPIRLWNLNAGNVNEGVVYSTIYHFGYAINEEMMRYKMSIHGHKSEIRPEWFEIWRTWKGENIGLFHPTSFDIWKEIVPFDKEDLPLKDHPYFNLSQI